MSLGGFWLQFPLGHRECYEFWTDHISGPGRERRNVFLPFPLVLPDWYAACSPAVPYSSWRDWEQCRCEPWVPDPNSLKEQKLHLHAMWVLCVLPRRSPKKFGHMNNFVNLNNGACHPEGPSQLTSCFTARSGEEMEMDPWIHLKYGNKLEKTRGSLTFASSSTWEVNGMLNSQQRDMSLQFLSVLLTQQAAFHMRSHRSERRRRLFVYIFFDMHRCSDLRNWE